MSNFAVISLIIGRYSLFLFTIWKNIDIIDTYLLGMKYGTPRENGDTMVLINEFIYHLMAEV